MVFRASTSSVTSLHSYALSSDRARVQGRLDYRDVVEAYKMFLILFLRVKINIQYNIAQDPIVIIEALILPCLGCPAVSGLGAGGGFYDFGTGSEFGFPGLQVERIQG